MGRGGADQAPGRAPSDLLGAGGQGRGARGFTLLELVLVLAILALAAGMIVPAMGGWSRAGKLREAVGGIRTMLLVERVEAMRRGERRRLEVTAGESGLAATSGGELRSSWDAGGIGLRDSAGRVVERLAAEFDASGRTVERRWEFRAEGPRGGGAGTMWAIVFDPVTGAAELRRGGAEGTGIAPRRTATDGGSS